MEYDVIIVGSGPAGLTAGLYLGRAGKRVAIISGTLTGGAITLTESIENYSGIMAIDGYSLTMTMKAQAEKFGAEFIDGEVKSFEFNDIKTVLLDDGRTLAANNIILAMGTQKRKMGIANEDNLVGQGISYCATCDGNFFRKKTVAVFGGGDTAVTDALYLAKLCKKVYVIHRRDTFRASNILIERMENTQNIEIIRSSIITELKGEPLEEITVKNVVTEGITELDLNGLFVAIGTMPNTETVKGLLKLDGSGYIETDAHMRTSVKGVFAVGDIRTTPLRQVITACADGAVAAETIINNN